MFFLGDRVRNKCVFKVTTVSEAGNSIQIILSLPSLLSPRRLRQYQ